MSGGVPGASGGGGPGMIGSGMIGGGPGGMGGGMSIGPGGIGAGGMGLGGLVPGGLAAMPPPMNMNMNPNVQRMNSNSLVDTFIEHGGSGSHGVPGHGHGHANPHAQAHGHGHGGIGAGGTGAPQSTTVHGGVVNNVNINPAHGRRFMPGQGHPGSGSGVPGSLPGSLPGSSAPGSMGPPHATGPNNAPLATHPSGAAPGGAPPAGLHAASIPGGGTAAPAGGVSTAPGHAPGHAQQAQAHAPGHSHTPGQAQGQPGALNPSTTRITTVPLANSDRTIPPLNGAEMKALRKWMERDKEYEAAWRGRGAGHGVGGANANVMSATVVGSTDPAVSAAINARGVGSRGAWYEDVGNGGGRDARGRERDMNGARAGFGLLWPERKRAERVRKLKRAGVRWEGIKM